MCDTVKSRIRGTPKDFQLKDKQQIRGTMRQVATNFNGVQMYYTSWQDSRIVNLLSTYQCSRDEVTRSSKVEGRYRELVVTRPSIIGEYNYGMSGTDKIDQKIAYYRIRLKTMHWKRKIYAHLMNIAIVNIHILFKLSRKLQAGDKGYRLLEFMEMLITEICYGTKEDIPKEVLRPANSKKRSKLAMVDNPSRLLGYHEPVHLKFCSKKVGNKVKVCDNRRKCVVCNDLKCMFICEQCNVALCVKTKEEQADKKFYSCWYKFHNLPAFRRKL